MSEEIVTRVPMDERTQQEIAEGLKAGSPEAWLRLHEEYARRLWQGLARLTGGDSVRVADMVQQSFLAAAESAAGFDPRRGSLWAWLWGIARRQVALDYRKNGSPEELQRAKQWWMSRHGQGNLSIANSPPEELESRELATLVRAALAELPTKYQILLEAKYIEEASSAQIALDIGVSPSAVDSRLARARQAFRRAFGKMTHTL